MRLCIRVLDMHTLCGTPVYYGTAMLPFNEEIKMPVDIHKKETSRHYESGVHTEVLVKRKRYMYLIDVYMYMYVLKGPGYSVIVNFRTLFSVCVWPDGREIRSHSLSAL